MFFNNKLIRKRYYRNNLINIIIIVKMKFLNHRFLLFNNFNNFIKNFRRDIIIMKTYLLINFINYINKFRKILDK